MKKLLKSILYHKNIKHLIATKFNLIPQSLNFTEIAASALYLAEWNTNKQNYELIIDKTQFHINFTYAIKHKKRRNFRYAFLT